MVVILNGSEIIKHKSCLDFEHTDNRHIFSMIDGSQILKKLNDTLSINNHAKDIEIQNKKKLYKVLNNINKETMRKYCTIIIKKNYDNYENIKEINSKMSLFQTAFIEMEALFIDEPRNQKSKTGFHHLLGVLENIISGPNPTIEKCIVAMLHDAVEDIPGYTIEHIKNIYGEKIAISVENISKKPLSCYGNTKENRSVLRNIRKNDYYGNMRNRGNNELDVKFADRLNSLETMYTKDEQKKDIMDKNYLLKKILETEKYFLNSELKGKVSEFHYDKLEKKYLERKEKLKNQNLI